MRSLVRKLRRFACHLQVTIVYTAPTAIRSLMAKGNDVVKKASRKSLRILGTVGEPINVEAWKWYHEVRLHCVPTERVLLPCICETSLIQSF